MAGVAAVDWRARALDAEALTAQIKERMTYYTTVATDADVGTVKAWCNGANFLPPGALAEAVTRLLRRVEAAEARAAEFAQPGDVLELRRAVFELIELARAAGHNDRSEVVAAKELIRCIVQGCGLAGACDGTGTDNYPCPLRRKL